MDMKTHGTERKTEGGVMLNKYGTMKTILMAVTISVFFLSAFIEDAYAHYGQGSGAERCTNCHSATDTDATINLAVNGTDVTATPSITVTEGEIIEIDYYYNNVADKDNDGPMLSTPSIAWPVLRGTEGSAPSTWVSGNTWKSVWDKTAGRASGWLPFTPDGVDVTEGFGYGIPFIQNDVTDGVQWGETGGAVLDDGLAGDLDTVSQRMGADARIYIPKGTTAGTTINIYGVGHDATLGRAHVVTTLTFSTVNTSAEGTAPTDGASLTATPHQESIELSWDAATDAGSGVAFYRVMYLEGTTAPASCSTGLQVYAGPETNAVHFRELGSGYTTLGGSDYSYRVCAYDNAGNVSSGLTVSSALAGSGQEIAVGDGTDPADASPSPGATAQYIDEFNVSDISATNASGTFSEVEVTLSDYTLVDTVEIRSSDGLTTYGSVTNPSSNIVTVPVTGTDVIGRNDSFTYRVYVDIDAAASGTLTAVVTNLTVSGTTFAYSADYDSATFTISGSDSTAPDVVSDLATGTVTANSVALSWTAPGDDGAVGTATTYDVRYSTAGAITDANWASATPATGEPAPSIAGTTENFTVTGLSPSTPYWFAIRTSDEVPNTSLTSNSPTATTSAGADLTAPDVVSDLATGAVTASTIALSWTAPGDDGAVGTATTYDVRYSTAGAITDANWASATPATGEPAPSIAGTTENFTVTGLAASQQYWFAIRTSDEVPNTALTSNSPTATTSAACVPAQPTVSLAPAAQTIPNDGGLVVYTATITNNDVNCADSTFTLSVNDTNTTEFYTSVLSNSSKTLASGASDSATVTVQVFPGNDAVTNDTTVTVTDSPTHDPPVVSSPVTTTVTLGGGCVGNGVQPNASAGGTLIFGR